MSAWTILCDFDGTISLADVTDALLERFGQPGWRALETAWQRGEIGSRACMAGQVALLDADRAELDAFLDELPIDPAFPAFVTAVQEAGISLTVVSDGIDHAIRRVLERHALGHLPVLANRLEAHGERSWRLAFPYAVATCSSGNCKCAVAGRAHVDRQRVLLIGDGASDFCVAGEADLVFAKDRLVEHCLAAAIPHRAITGFADAIDLLPLLAGDASVAA